MVVKTGLRREGEEDFGGDAFRSERISSVVTTMVTVTDKNDGVCDGGGCGGDD